MKLLLEFIRDDDVYNYLENLYKYIEEDLIESYSIDLEMMKIRKYMKY